MTEVFNAIALTQIANIGTISAKYLYDTLGSATAVMENRNNIKDVIPDATLLLTESLKNVDDAFRIAEQEVEFIEQKNIKPLCMNDEAYPQRLLNCDDAPIILYYCGNADLNAKHIISMVGTRNCSQYGKELCKSFVADL
ncbi:MAG: DNA-processing protein DprA, partial [Bacteroidaceae bacterium]|nr:DNA-processing protein DprA [Bacteroidaceae bacterium]